MNIQELLKLAINENKQIRDQALFEIDSNFTIIKDYLFMEPIDQLKIIYINYWIEQNYSNYQIQDVKQAFKHQVYQLYSSTKSELLEKSIINIIQYDFPNDISLLQQLVQLDVPIKHKVIKRLFKEFGLTPYLQQFIQLQQQNEFHEPYIKILIQQSRILPYDGEILKYIHAIQKSIPLNNQRIIYLYQKAIISSLQFQKNQPANDIIELIKYINQFYLSNQHNVDLVDIQQFEQSLQQYKQQKNKNQQLFAQILMMLKQIVLNFTLSTYLDLYVGYEEVELWLFEKCLGNILNFILNYSLLLTPSQVYDVFYDNEAYYAEENDESYEIRQLSIDFLKLACDGMNQDNVIEQIVQRIDFDLQINDYLSMIRKEAMYYILADLQDIINFDFDKYFNMFISELSNLQFQHILLPLKVQIWRIIKNQVQSNEEMPLDVLIQIINTIQQLYAKDNCCFLIQIEIINLLFDHCPNELISQLWVELQNRYDTLQYQQSKMIVYEFYKNTIKLNNDFQWMLQRYVQEWNNANLNMQSLIIEVLQDINQNYNLFYQQSLEFVNNCYLSKEAILIEGGTKLLVLILSKGYKISQQQCEFYQTTLLEQIIDNIDLWKQGLQLQLYIFQNPFNKDLLYKCLIKQLSKRNEIKPYAFKDLFTILEYVHKDIYINYFEYLVQDEFYYEFIHLIGLYGQRGPDLQFQQLIQYYLQITDIHRVEVFINLLRAYQVDESIMRVYLEELKSKQLEPQQSQFLLSLKSI